MNYLDDVLMVTGGGCIVAATALTLGLAGALAAAGVWCVGLAILYAKGKEGDDHAPAAGDPDDPE